MIEWIFMNKHIFIPFPILEFLLNILPKSHTRYVTNTICVLNSLSSGKWCLWVETPLFPIFIWSHLLLICRRELVIKYRRDVIRIKPLKMIHRSVVELNILIFVFKTRLWLVKLQVAMLRNGSQMSHVSNTWSHLFHSYVPTR